MRRNFHLNRLFKEKTAYLPFNNMKLIAGLILLLVLPTFTFSQGVFVGKVTDSISGLPIPYATIRIEGRPLGLYTDESGSFRVSGLLDNDIIIISCVGYKTTRESLNKIHLSPVIGLSPLVNVLEEVVVSKSVTKEVKTIDFISKKANYTFSAQIAVELVTRIFFSDTIPSKTKTIKAVRIKIKKTGSDNPCRLHVYEETQLGTPGREILPVDIVVSSDKIKGNELSIDLSQYNVMTNSNAIFIGIEWIGNVKENKNFGPKVSVTHATSQANTYTRTILNNEYEWVLLGKPVAGFNTPPNLLVAVTYQ